MFGDVFFHLPLIREALFSMTFGLPLSSFSLAPSCNGYPRQHALGGYRVYLPPCTPPQVMLLSCTGSSLFCFLCVCGFSQRCTVHHTCSPVCPPLPLTCSLCQPLTTQVICQQVQRLVTRRLLRPVNLFLGGTHSDLLLGGET